MISLGVRIQCHVGDLCTLLPRFCRCWHQIGVQFVPLGLNAAQVHLGLSAFGLSCLEFGYNVRVFLFEVLGLLVLFVPLLQKQLSLSVSLGLGHEIL